MIRESYSYPEVGKLLEDKARIHSALVGELEAIIARLMIDKQQLKAALEKIIARREKQLEVSCPDCSPNCTHGIEYCSILKIAREALEKGA
jgi:hypothetical protein